MLLICKEGITIDILEMKNYRYGEIFGTISMKKNPNFLDNRIGILIIKISRNFMLNLLPITLVHTELGKDACPSL